MKYEPKDRIVSIERSRNDALDKMETKVVMNHSCFSVVDKLECARIIPGRNSGTWNIYFHKYDETISELLKEDSFEIKSYRCEKNVKSSLKSILSDMDSGMFI